MGRDCDTQHGVCFYIDCESAKQSNAKTIEERPTLKQVITLKNGSFDCRSCLDAD